MKRECRKLDCVIVLLNGELRQVWFEATVDEFTGMIVDWQTHFIDPSDDPGLPGRTLH